MSTLEYMRISGRKLRRERERQILSHRELARKAAVSPTTVIALENDEIKRPHPRTIRKLSEALGVDPAYILED
jgi:transcriptional regulator with XRE-family HTH domain